MASSSERKTSESEIGNAVTDVDTVFFMMEEISRSARLAFEGKIKDLGLNRTQWRILIQLIRDSFLSQSELAEILELERATIGLAVTGLEKEGYLSRMRHTEDRRAWRLFLLPKVQKVLPILREAADEVYALLWNTISSSEKEALIASLTKVTKAARKL